MSAWWVFWCGWGACLMVVGASGVDVPVWMVPLNIMAGLALLRVDVAILRFLLRRRREVRWVLTNEGHERVTAP